MFDDLCFGDVELFRQSANRLTLITQRLYKRGLYLLTMNINQEFYANEIKAFPQAHATVDDFGTLVIVRNWS
jgi:hypothetical protein